MATERVDLLVRIARARVYAIKADTEIARHSQEVADLERDYETLLDDYETLRADKGLGHLRQLRPGEAERP